MKLFLIIAIILITIVPHQTIAQSSVKSDTVYFKTDMHCESCKAKLSEVLRFEKGVKAFDLEVSSNTILVAFHPAKTTKEKLAAAITKSGKKADQISKSEFRLSRMPK